jgi:AraC-like DNA-binding protein
LSDALHINKYHISHLFGEKLGMGVVEYVNIRRVAAACDELKKTRKSVTEIALSVGFNSPRSLNRAFKKVLGKTPLEYKRASV